MVNFTLATCLINALVENGGPEAQKSSSKWCDEGQEYLPYYFDHQGGSINACPIPHRSHPFQIRHDKMVDEIAALVGEYTSRGKISDLITEFTNEPRGHLSRHNEKLIKNFVIEPLRKYKVALVVVDFQNDFVSGSLSVRNGSAGHEPLDAVEPLNVLLKESKIDLVVFTKDWHPDGHISFYENHRDQDRKLSEEGDKRNLNVFDLARFEKPETLQVLYPTHCVQNTWGSEIVTEIEIPAKSKIIYKGINKFVDSYSAFFDNSKKRQTELDKILAENGITVVLTAGVAYDICVAETVKDSADLDFLTGVIPDCSAGFIKEGVDRSNKEFKQKKIAIMESKAASDVINRRRVPIEWVEVLMNKAKTDIS